MSEIIKECLHCGGTIEINAKTGIPTCIYCGRQYKDSVGDLSGELREIVSHRQMREFIQAEERCAELLAKQPENAEAHWQSLLSALGVVYVTENGKAKPTFFSYSYDNRERIFENEYYKNAIKFAPSAQDRAFYEEKATELDSLLSEFFALVAKENSYDIFISFKHTEKMTGADGEERIVETDDYVKAKEIYDYFKDKYKVFFSPVSIGQDTGIAGEKYEPRILKALQTAQAMILVGTKKQYIEAQWVENEWRRFRYYICKDRKRKDSLILGYMKNMPGLPAALKDIQLPSVDMFKSTYLKELEAKLSSFVKTSKGLKSVFTGKKIKSTFADEEGSLSFGENIERIKITSNGSGETIRISANEQREMEFANSSLKNANFSVAISSFTNLLNMNRNNAEAYYGRFLANCRATNSFDLVKRVDNIKPKFFADFEEAIKVSADEKYSWKIVESLIACLAVNAKWQTQKQIFDLVAKYADAVRAKHILENLKKRYQICLNQKKIPVAEEIFASARNVFLEENNKDNINYLSEFAYALFSAGYYDRANKYYEELVLARRSASSYYFLLCCRVKAKSIESAKFGFKIREDESASDKKPSELGVGDIIERIMMCAGGNVTQEVSLLHKCTYYQIRNNRSQAKAFVETIQNCHAQLEKEDLAKNFLLEAGNVYLECHAWADARICFKQLLHYDSEDSRGHWGLLKANLSAANDAELAKKRKKLERSLDFENARNCASEQEFAYYMSIANGNVPSGSGSRSKTVTRPAQKPSRPRSEGEGGAIVKSILGFIPVILTLVMTILLIVRPMAVFAFIHWGWVIAATLIVAVLTVIFTLAIAWEEIKEDAAIWWWLIFIPAFLIPVSIYMISKAYWTADSEPGKKVSGFIKQLLSIASIVLMIVGLVRVSDSPLEISNSLEFGGISNVPDAYDRDFYLSADIDFGGGSTGAFGAIDNYGGLFDGRGYSIKNLVINKTVSVTDEEELDEWGRNVVGLFKTINEYGAVKNLIVRDSVINITVDDENTSAFGVIAGRNNGIIDNCLVENTYMYVEYKHALPEKTSYLGGVSGINNAVIRNTRFENSGATDIFPYSITYFTRTTDVSVLSLVCNGISAYNSAGESVFENCYVSETATFGRARLSFD